MRRQVHVAPSAERTRADEMSGLQKTRAQNHFQFQLADQIEAAVDFRRQAGRIYRAQAREQGRIRETISQIEVAIDRAPRGGAGCPACRLPRLASPGFNEAKRKRRRGKAPEPADRNVGPTTELAARFDWPKTCFERRFPML